MIGTYELLLTCWGFLRRAYPHFEAQLGEGIALLTRYYVRSEETTAHAFAMLLNPAIKDMYLLTNWTPEARQAVMDKFFARLGKYQQRLQVNQPPPPDDGATGSVIIRNAFGSEFEDMAKLMAEHGTDLAAQFVAPTPSQNAPASTVDAEWHDYRSLSTLPEDKDGSDTSPTLKFWHQHRERLPTLFAMAMDVLPAQSTSVPCEQLFSSGVDTMTKKRNRISPDLMEILQMLKFVYRKERINFTAHHRVLDIEVETAPTQDHVEPQDNALVLYASSAERALRAGGTAAAATLALSTSIGEVDAELELVELARAAVGVRYGF
ncbi:unnamed protein product [Peniophora sp. CBMAI 1063]|nr:unnamed protein product [Peniophora sp. CBMAI 1063]